MYHGVGLFVHCSTEVYLEQFHYSLFCGLLIQPLTENRLVSTSPTPVSYTHLRTKEILSTMNKLQFPFFSIRIELTNEDCSQVTRAAATSQKLAVCPLKTAKCLLLSQRLVMVNILDFPLLGQPKRMCLQDQYVLRCSCVGHYYKVIHIVALPKCV